MSGGGGGGGGKGIKIWLEGESTREIFPGGKGSMSKFSAGRGGVLLVFFSSAHHPLPCHITSVTGFFEGFAFVR